MACLLHSLYQQEMCDSDCQGSVPAIFSLLGSYWGVGKLGRKGWIWIFPPTLPAELRGDVPHRPSVLAAALVTVAGIPQQASNAHCVKPA